MKRQSRVQTFVSVIPAVTIGLSKVQDTCVVDTELLTPVKGSPIPLGLNFAEGNVGRI